MRFRGVDGKLDWKRSIAEISWIVIGVLIALGGNSWWEDRKDRERETAYLRQLLSDIRENERRLETAIQNNEEVLDVVDGFLAFVYSNGPLPPADSVRTPVGFSVYEPLTGTYTALVGNGDLQLLLDDDLRFQILAYGAEMAATREVLGYLAPMTWRNLERVTLSRVASLRSGAADGLASSGRWREAPDVGELLGDLDLVAAMSVQRGVNANRISRLRGLQRPTRRLRCLLEAEIEGIEAIEVEPADSLVVGDTTELEATVRYATGLTLEECGVEWGSGDSGVATVDDSGTVTGVAAGATRITARFRGASRSVDLTVHAREE